MIVYAVVMDWATDEEHGHNEDLFGSYDDAQECFGRMLEEERANGCILKWMDNEQFEVDESEGHYECWLDGEYWRNHFKLSIEKKILFVR